MQLSTKVRYALRAMVELALKYGQGPVRLKEIAESQDISLKYLEQVMLPLRVGGYVKTQKGSRGGYLLARKPEEVTVLEILESLEGSLSPVECADNPDICARKEICAVREIWVGLKAAIMNELGNYTLAALADKQKSLNRSD